MTDYKSPLKEALCKFKQLNIKIHKESDNPYFKSKYADLSVILTAIENDAAKVGLVITSRLDITSAGERILITELEHKDSMERIASIFPVFGAKPQEIGSSVTYARRYNIQSLLNLAAEDDDGNAANDSTQIHFKTARERTKVHNEIMDALNATTNLQDLQETWLSHTENLNRLKASDTQVFYNLENRKNELKVSFQAIVNEAN
jgi:hypothetical protein